MECTWAIFFCIASRTLCCKISIAFKLLFPPAAHMVQQWVKCGGKNVLYIMIAYSQLTISLSIRIMAITRQRSVQTCEICVFQDRFSSIYTQQLEGGCSSDRKWCGLEFWYDGYKMRHWNEICGMPYMAYKSSGNSVPLMQDFYVQDILLLNWS